LVPASAWLEKTVPTAPDVKSTREGNKLMLHWIASAQGEAFRYVLYYQYGKIPAYTILNRGDLQTQLMITREGTPGDTLTYVALTAVGRTGNESSRTIIPVE